MKQEKFLYEDIAEFLNQSDQPIKTAHLAWLIRGIVLGKLGRYEEAIDSYNQALEADLMNSEILYYKGVALVALGQRQEAIATFEQALKIKPDYHKAWREQAFLFFALNHLEQAVEAWDKALEIEPDDPRSWYKRGVTLSRLNRIEDAINSYTKALELKPDYRQAQCNRDLLLRNLKIIKFQSEDHRTCFNRGVELYETESYEDALEVWRIALKIKEDYPEAWYYQGLTLCKLGCYQEAIFSCDQALKINPDYQEAWDRRGISLMKLGNYEEAIASFEKALSLKPNSYEILYDLGMSLTILGRYEEAIVSYNSALEIQPNSYAILNHLGISLSMLGRNEEAIAIYNQAISINPDFHVTWVNIGVSQYHLGQYQEAIASYDRALAINPNDKVSKKYRNSALYKLERIQKLSNIDEDRLEIYASLIKQVLACSNDEEIKLVFIKNHHLIDTNFLFVLKQSIRIYSERSNEDAVQRLSQLRPLMGKALQEVTLEHSNTTNTNLSDLDYGNSEDDLSSNPYLKIMKEERNREKNKERRAQFILLSLMIGSVILTVTLGKKFLWLLGMALLSLVGLGVLYFLFYAIWRILNYGEILHDQEKYQEALSFYDTILIFLRKSSWHWFQRARALHRLGRYEEALASYDKALRFQPQDYRVWNNRGILLSEMDRFDESIDSYNQSLAIKREENMALYNRGKSLDALERYDEAIISYDEFISITPTVSAWLARGITFLYIEDYQDAIRSFDQALSLEPSIQDLLNPSRNFAFDIQVIPSVHRELVEKSRYQTVRAMREFARGKLAHLRGNLNLAINHYYSSIYYAELSSDIEPRKNRRDQLLEASIVSVFFSLVNVLVEADRPEEALEIVEKIKGRKLREQFKNFTDEPARPLSPQGRDPLITSSVQLANTMADWVNEMYGMPYENELDTQIAISFEEIRNLLPSPRTVLIEWFVTDRTTHAFIITKTSYAGQCVKVLSINQNKSKELFDWFTSYDKGYGDIRESILKGEDISFQENRWDKDLLLQLQRLSDLLQMKDIVDYITLAAPECDSLILVPHLFLHLLPLHALPICYKDNILLDHFPNSIRYFPSCSLLKLSSERSQRWDAFFNIGRYNLPENQS